MEFLILGPIEVRNAAGAIALGGMKPRAVLAVLLLHPNEPVSAERLALALWGEDAPGGAVKTVQVHVSRLRKALGDADAVTTSAAGYCLRVRRGELDSERFESLVDDAREALDGQPEDAAALLREALALWRGPALAELSLEPFAGTEIARLEEQRLAALELRADADLAAGRHAEVVGELRQLTADHPTRERLAGQLMLALYRCGRQTEALEAYAAARRVLVEQVGVEPGPQLRDLHQAILRQDAGLEPQQAESELPAALDTTTAKPLAGRDKELAWLLSRWERARAGTGGLVALTGVHGSGKSRLAGELARSVHGHGVSILHATGKGPADTILVALRRLREAIRPTLLVIDDAGSAGAGVRSELERLVPALAAAPVLIVACAPDADAFEYAGDTLELHALDAEAVREIAARYAPARPAAEVPAGWLLEASGGVPLRVHDVASQWARREAARHVDTVAGRAEAGRAELRSIEQELAGGVAELQESRERIAPGGGGDDRAVVCPYKGLASYGVGDAEYFFGRERLIAALVARLVGAPLLGVVGPSGSGKSSVLRAGLLPALAGGVLPGSERWRQVLVRPGEHPLRELGVALAGAQDSDRVLLAIDQFEETFTACDDEEERAAFVAEVVSAARDPGGRYVVVLALRADSYGRCAAYPELAGLLAASNVLVGAMQRDELVRVVERPAERAGLRVEPELVDALVADVEREPGGLPLLSTALLELWQHRDGRRLRLAAYERMGGVHGAVARLAEAAFAQLDAAQQAIARDVLMRLVGAGEDEAVERRRIALEELEIERDEDVARVVALLTDHRLLTVSAGTVELAHEALLREWPRLREWVREDREGLRIRRGLGAAAREWDELRRDDGMLFRGARLTEAIEWRDGRGLALNELERAFLAASESARERERVTRRRRTAVVLTSVSFVVLAGVAIAIAAFFADRAGDAAASRNLATKSASVVAFDPGGALAIAREALGRSDTEQARNALRQATLNERGTRVVKAHDGEVYIAAPSADGRRVVTTGADGAVKVWRLADGHLESTPTKYAEQGLAAALSPDGKRVASASYAGAVTVRALAGGAPAVKHLEGDFAISLAYSPDGAKIALGTNTGTVWILGADLSGPGYKLDTHAEPVYVVSFSGDSTKLVSAGEADVAKVWDVAGRKLLREFAAGSETVQGADLDAHGTRVATGSDGGRLRVWNVATGERLHAARVDDLALYSVRFDAAGRRVVTGSRDGAVRVVDVRSGALLNELKGHASAAQYADFVPGSDTIVSGGWDGTLRVWAPLRVVAARVPAMTPTFSPDGELVAGGGDDGSVRLWDPAGGRETLVHTFSKASVAAFSSDGTRIVSASRDGAASVYDIRARSSQAVKTEADPEHAKYAVAMDGEGRIALGGESADISVQRADGSTSFVLKGHDGPVAALAFSPDGVHLASGSDDGTTRIWNLKTRQQERRMPTDEETVESAAYSRDGERLVTAGADGTVRVWPAGGGDAVVLVGHVGQVVSARFDATGTRVVSAGVDGTVRVWDAAGGDTLAVLYRHKRDATGADISRAGRVVSSGPDAMLTVPCEVCGSFSQVRRIAGARASRRLSDRDRLRYLGSGG